MVLLFGRGIGNTLRRDPSKVKRATRGATSTRTLGPGSDVGILEALPPVRRRPGQCGALRPPPPPAVAGGPLACAWPAPQLGPVTAARQYSAVAQIAGYPCRTVLPASRGRGQILASVRRRRCGDPRVRGGRGSLVAPSPAFAVMCDAASLPARVWPCLDRSGCRKRRRCSLRHRGVSVPARLRRAAGIPCEDLPT
jgi:hypothetical protein